MNLVHKLGLAMVVPALLIWIVGVYATSVTEASLRSSIESTAALRAKAVMDEIDRTIDHRAAGWAAFVRSTIVRETLAASNERFEALDDPRARIDAWDDEWQRTPPNEVSPFMADLLDNRLARDLIALRVALEKAAV